MKLSFPEEIKTEDEAARRLLDAIHQRDRDEQISTAVSILREALAADKSPNSYYYVFQSNIAMAFLDELRGSCATCYHFKMQDHEIHEIANKAARRFLDNLIGEV